MIVRLQDTGAAAWRSAFAAAVALALIALASPASAALTGWLTAGPGNWANGGNWSTGLAPVAGDFVEIGTPAFPAAGVVTSNSAGQQADEIVIGTNGSLLVTAGDLSLIGTIDIAGSLDGSGGAVINPGRVFVQIGASMTLDGAGTTMNIAEGLFNDGEVELTDQASIDTGPVKGSILNTHLFSAKSGALVKSRSLTNAVGAEIDAQGSNTKFQIDNAFFGNGTTTVKDDAIFQTGSIDIVGNALETALLNVRTGGQVLSTSLLNGEFGNVSVQDLDSELAISGDINNNGVVSVENGGLASSASFENRNGAQVDINNGTLNAGSVMNNAGAQFSVTAGTAQVAGAIHNIGLLEGKSGGTINAALLTNDGQTNLSGAATANITSVSNQADFSVEGLGTTLNAQTIANAGNLEIEQGAQAVAAVFDNEASGSLSLRDAGSTLTVNGTLNNDGNIHVETGSVIDAQALIQHQGTLVLDQGTVATNVAASIAGGSISGAGNIDGNLGVDVNGVASPGLNPGDIGVFEISGDLSTGGTLVVDIGGLGEGVDSDLLNIGGIAYLGGDVQANILPGLVANIGDVFVFLRAADVQFGFHNLICGDCAALGLELLIGADFAALTVPAPIPLPAPIVLLLPPLAWLAVTGRRREKYQRTN